MKHCLTNVDGVTATIAHEPGGYVVLRLHGPSALFRGVAIEDIASRYGFLVDVVISANEFQLGAL